MFISHACARVYNKQNMYVLSVSVRFFCDREKALNDKAVFGKINKCID